MSGDYGFIEWTPYSASKKKLEIIHAILAEYEDHLPLTMRQIFYRAVGKHDYGKTEAAYKQLLYVSAKGRRARLIEFDAIRDDGTAVEEPLEFDGLKNFRHFMIGMAKTYRRRRQFNQDRILLLLCEAAGMVPQLAKIADPLWREGAILRRL